MPTAPSDVPSAVTSGGLTRRTALVSALAAGIVTTGCTPRAESSSGGPARTVSPRVDPDVALAAAVLTREQDLFDAVRATRKRHRSLRVPLAATQSTHAKHIELLREAVPEKAQAGSGTSPSPSPSAEQPPTPVPGEPRKAMLALSRREHGLSLAHKRSAFAAESGAFARLLASMAAAAAQQSVALGQRPVRQP